MQQLKALHGTLKAVQCNGLCSALQWEHGKDREQWDSAKVLYLWDEHALCSSAWRIWAAWNIVLFDGLCSALKLGRTGGALLLFNTL